MGPGFFWFALSFFETLKKGLTFKPQKEATVL